MKEPKSLLWAFVVDVKKPQDYQTEAVMIMGHTLDAAQ